MSSFYLSRSRKRKKDSEVKQHFVLWGSEHVKAVCKQVDEINPWCVQALQLQFLSLGLNENGHNIRERAFVFVRYLH